MKLFPEELHADKEEQSGQRCKPTDQALSATPPADPKLTPFALSLWVGCLLKIHWRTWRRSDKIGLEWPAWETPFPENPP